MPEDTILDAPVAEQAISPAEGSYQGDVEYEPDFDNQFTLSKNKVQDVDDSVETQWAEHMSTLDTDEDEEEFPDLDLSTETKGDVAGSDASQSPSEPRTEENEDKIGFAADMGLQVLGASRDAVQNGLESSQALGNWLGTELGEQIWDDEFDVHVDTFDGLLPEVQESDRVSGQLVRGAVQFLVGYIPALRALKFVKGPLTKAFAAGAIADAAVFDPQVERLSNWLQEFPIFDGPITEYLAYKEGDTAAEGRFKNALEGMGLGVIATGVYHAVRALRGYIKNKGINPESGETFTKELGIPDKLETKEAKPIYGSKSASAVRINEAGKTAKTTPDPFSSIDIPLEGKTIKINPAKITDEISLKETMAKVSKQYADVTDSDPRIASLAENLGMTAEDLVAKGANSGVSPSQMIAAGDMLNSSLLNVKGLAAKMDTLGATDLDRVNFRRAMDVHASIQLEASGLSKEAGRALQSGQIAAKTQREQLAMVNEMMADRGGRGSTDEMAKRVRDLKTPKDINNFVKRQHGATGFDIMNEFYLGGLLSGPSTQAVNVVSTFSHMAMQIPERALAGVSNKLLRREGGVEMREGLAMVQSLKKGLETGFSVARETWRTEGLMDASTKLEGINKRAITAHNLSQTFIGKNTIDPILKGVNMKTLDNDGIAGYLADGLGTVIRNISTRPLMTADGMFKGISSTMETYALATRRAIQEGFSGKELDDRISTILNDLPDDIAAQAKTYAEQVTFTDPNKFAKSIQEMSRTAPPTKLAVPFTNTLMNIAYRGLERTPLGVLSPGKNSIVRADLSGANGKAAADMAKSKMVMGTSLLWMATSAEEAGVITGGMPTDPELRRAAQDAGFQEYSFVTTDENGVKEYIPYKNLEPVRTLLGMGADISQIKNDMDDKEAGEIIEQSAASFYNLVGNGLWMNSAAEMFDAIKDPTRNSSTFKNLAASFAVPNFVNKITQQMDPYLRDSDGAWEAIKSRIPGASESVPLRRNFFGEPIVRRFRYDNEDGSVDAVNMLYPGYKETENPEGVVQEIYDNDIQLSMPAETFNRNNASVKLTAKEYNDRLLAQGEVLKPILEQLINTSDYQNLTSGGEGGKAFVIKQMVTRVRSNRELEAKWLQENPQVLERWQVEAERKQEELLGGNQ
jgi:hypothetical protein